MFFDVLRQEIGEEAFFNGLQSYYQDHKYGIAHTDDLLDAFESAAGRQLDDLYQEWLYSAQE
jgi:aminopeptidase N